MSSASSFLFLIIIFLILSSTLFCSAIPIGHYDGEWKLLEVSSDNLNSSMINEMISRFFPQLLNDENNNFFKNHILKHHPSSYSNTKSIRRMLPGGSSSSIDDDDDDDTNNVNNNTTTARGVFRLHSVFNLTSQTISTTMNMIQGRYIAPGRLREIISSDGECVVGGAGAQGDLFKNCYGYSKGFLGFWDTFFLSSSSSSSSPNNHLIENQNDTTTRTEHSHLARFKQSVLQHEKESSSFLQQQQQQQQQKSRRSFRQLLNPVLWSEEEEEEFSKCIWITSFISNDDQHNHSLEEEENPSSFIFLFFSSIFQLFRILESPSTMTPLSDSSQRQILLGGGGGESLSTTSTADQSIEGLAIGYCPFSSSFGSSSSSSSSTTTTTVFIHFNASKDKFNTRMLSSNWFAGLTVISAMSNAFAIFSLGTLSRRSLQVQRALSFASLLWIVSWDLLYLGVFQLLAKLTARSCRVIYIGMFIRVLTFYVAGVPLILRIRKTQNNFLLGEQRGRWLVADFSVWRFFGLIIIFTITLFLLAERILSWPMMLIFSGVFWPQIVQNVKEDEATQPILQFTWGTFISLCLPVFCLTQDFFESWKNPFDFEPRGTAALAFTVSLFLQAAILHIQVKFGARSFIPAVFLPPRFPYEVPKDRIVFGRGEYDRDAAAGVDEDKDASKMIHYLEKQMTCSICQGYLRSDPFSFDDDSDDEGDQHRNEDDDESTMLLNKGSRQTSSNEELQKLIEESSSTNSTNDKKQKKSDDDVSKTKTSTAVTLWKTPCEHYFHSSCLSNWLQVRLVCPVCREIVPKP